MIKKIIRFFVCRWNMVCPKHGLPTNQFNIFDGVNTDCPECSQDQTRYQHEQAERKRQKQESIRSKWFL